MSHDTVRVTLTGSLFFIVECVSRYGNERTLSKKSLKGFRQQ